MLACPSIPLPSHRPLTLITGASSGIGATFARQLAASGHDLVLVARRLDRLNTLAAELHARHGATAEALEADLTKPDQRDRVAQRLASEPRLELLVNNAGFGTRRRFWEADLATQRQMHELHVTATVDLTHAALANMVPRGHGAVINVASVAGFSRSQSNVSYCATKTWMVAFTEGLALELEGLRSGVQVQALCPGFTYSEFHDVMGIDRKAIASWLWMKADDVVRDSLQALTRRKVIVVPGWHYRFFVFLMCHLPWKLKMALWGRAPQAKARLDSSNAG